MAARGGNRSREVNVLVEVYASPINTSNIFMVSGKLILSRFSSGLFGPKKT
jgi:hypothetical protein